MPRIAAAVSPEQLWQIFKEKTAKIMVEEGETAEDRFDFHEAERLDKVGADISKVQFNFENCEFETEGEDNIPLWEGMLGPRTLKANGGTLAYIGAMAGGDWEHPVYFIVYLDQNGKTLRGYVPKDGNVWNHKTKQAFGNDQEADREFFTKWAKANDIELAEDCEVDSGDYGSMLDRDAMLEDIVARIAVA